MEKTLVKPMDFHCDVCAVVSASGHLLGSKAGAEIDSANCVIRMNIAPTKGYEVDVGTRTSLRFAGFPNLMYGIFKANKIFEREKLPEKLLIWSGNTPQIRSVVKGEAKFLKKNHTGLDMYITTDREMKFHDELFAMETGKNRDSSKSWLSTGWFSIVLALKRCNRVKVYGMVEANHCEKTTARLDIPFHYYSMDNGYECMFYRKHEIGLKEGHRFFTEKYVFKKWARYFNLTFHYPEWDISKDDQRTPFLIKKTQSIPNPRYGVKRGPLPANFGNVREQNVRFPRTIEELRNNRFRPEKV
ncbi:alpha-N-acetylgalactosaminide alpha-2,6-sialyltransferase 5-like isoform X2 [Ptychodera flava]|uniref:alpha-N-acetylgalactosaminide alpha-2,6-sialyltransferase 5-like isoform X2 n=1 Tax=Ptychodera flava TaxID=63121 RepID=UPI00396A6628